MKEKYGILYIIYCIIGDITSIIKKIELILTNNHVALNAAFELSLTAVANKLFQEHIISSDVYKSPSYDGIIESFKASLKFKRSLPAVGEHCSKFLKALSNVPGPVSDAAEMIKDEWIELGISLNI